VPHHLGPEDLGRRDHLLSCRSEEEGSVVAKPLTRHVVRSLHLLSAGPEIQTLDNHIRSG
jgi:hypothetical protein